MSQTHDIPQERELRVLVTRHSVHLAFFARSQAGRCYTAVLPLAQLTALVGLVAEAEHGGPREFLLGFTPERLAFHQLAAVAMEAAR